MNISSEVEFSSSLPFFTLLQKEIRRFFAVAVQTILAPVISASLYLLVFGVSLGARVSVVEGFSYAQFIIPGLILMGVINNSFANVSSSLFMSRYLGNIVDLLVTPLTPAQLIAAYTLAAMFRGLLVGSVVFCVSLFFAELPWVSPFSALAIIFLSSFLFSQLGILAAIYSSTFDSLSVYNNFLILPLIYLGGLFYPVSLLPDFWKNLSMFNPLLYMIDGFRHAILGEGDIPLIMSFGVIATISGILFFWAATVIGKGYKLRA